MTVTGPRVRHEVERHRLLPGDQAGALQRRAQSPFDELVHPLRISLEHLFPNADDAFGLDLIADRRDDGILVGIVGEPHIGNAADHEAVHRDLRAARQPADRAGKVGNHRDLAGVGGGICPFPVAKQRKDVVLEADLGTALRRRRLEGDAAEEKRFQRLHLDLDPRPGELYRDPRGVPEPGLIVHIAVVWGADKGTDRHILGHVGDVPTEHLADIEIAEEHRRTEGYRSEPFSLQQESMPRDVG